ncbi:MAG: hypothetical protein A2Z30_00605 [Chloroflexi bacterium RBG_16_64_43]|nr:MAG: hypothetical protein A2Z30_00605 [Chloroflexi bacterium RBG_16_64_43]
MTRAQRAIGFGLLALGLAAPLVYVAASRAAGFSGFPLDDAFIHQTYARNLALRGAWSYSAGEVSAGSTSPLWTVLMAGGHVLRVGLPGWPIGLGIALSLLSAWLGGAWGERALGVPRLLGAAVLLGEWHLVWAAVSGMEIPLFVAWLMACWWLLARLEARAGAGWDAALGLGLVAAVGVWIRPEAILALPFLGLGATLARGSQRQRVWRGIAVLSPALISLLLYFTFNRLLGGGIWPNTFYAKQVEYGVLRGEGWVQRVGGQSAAILAGPLVVLAPFLLVVVYSALKQRRWERLVPMAWMIAHVAAYTARLPVSYQHGRYLIPVIPLGLLYGAAGLRMVWARMRGGLAGRVLVRGAWLSWGAVGLAFLVLGGRAYVRDVGLIDEEMVATARWVEAHTPEGAVIAAHDIGALGYYAERRLVDLGGLTSAAALTVLRDPRELAQFLTHEGSDYLVTFPGLYPLVGKRCLAEFSSGGSISPALGGENMRVYRWAGDCAERIGP